jgi:surface protein
VINYSLKASYVIQKDIEQIELIKLNNPEAILELIIDGEKVKPTNKYIFQKKGKYTVHMLLDMEKIDSIDNLFFGSISFASIYFTELFNIEKYSSMTGMFRNCKSLHTADLSKLNTKNIKKMDFLFSGCTALTSVDISHFSNENLFSMSRMFHHCNVLESLDLSNFKTPKVEDMSYAFADCNKIL